ncbi:biliverdin-producing heme oxygenase [Rhizobium sp.]
MTDKGSRFSLRDLTRDDHERLDALVGDFTDDDAYARYLTGMTVFRDRVERRLSEIDYPHTFGEWRPGLIADELKQDLADLGHDVPDNATPFDLPLDRDGLLGVLYVLEGSSLGARLLVRRAAELGYSADHGARHLAAQTSRPQTWSTFVAMLDGLAPSGLEKAAQAARMTFAAAIDAFSGIGYRERAR